MLLDDADSFFGPEFGRSKGLKRALVLQVAGLPEGEKSAAYRAGFRIAALFGMLCPNLGEGRACAPAQSQA